MNILPRTSVFLVKHFFKTRFRIAAFTRRHPRFGNTVRKVGFDGDDMVVLPKSGIGRRVEVNIEIEGAGDRNVVPSDLVKEVIRRSPHIFIMNFCLCRRSNGCQDFPVDAGCIFLGKGTAKIPPEYGHFADPEEACAYIDRCDDLGLVHIIGRNKLDSIWLHTGNHKDLMTICNCCPCCCLWNMVRDIDQGIAETYRRIDGVTVSLDADKCIGCGICSEGCFVRAITITDGKCILDDAKCRGCGRCTEQCPTKAITLEYDASVIQAEADRILALVNP